MKVLHFYKSVICVGDDCVHTRACKMSQMIRTLFLIGMFVYRGPKSSAVNYCLLMFLGLERGWGFFETRVL